MRANIERQYDRLELMAHEAMMHRHALNAKKVRPSDLFKRPEETSKARKKADGLRMKADETMAWLAQFEEFKDAEPAGKEAANGQ